MLNRFSKLLPSWLRTPRKPAILSDLDSIVIGEEFIDMSGRRATRCENPTGLRRPDLTT